MVKVPAVFMDRDGVLNEEVSYITSPAQLKIYSFAVEAVRQLKSIGWKCIVISNQSAVAKGLITEDELRLINQKVSKELPVDGIYYCPHYPPDNEEVLPYRVHCTCRKPAPGLILKAAAQHNIDLAKSYMVGDRAGDILAGQRAGLKTVLVCTGYGPQRLEQDVKPDYIFPDLKQFVDFLIDKGENHGQQT